MFGLPGRHPRVWPRLRNNSGEATAGIGLTRNGEVEAKSEEVPALPRENSISWPHCVCVGGPS